MRRRILLALTCLLLAIVSSVFFFFWYVPHALSRQYISVNFAPLFLSDLGSPLHIEYEGKAIDTGGIAVEINVTNSYFLPVYVNYDGFDVVWLIYNKSVAEPSDVMSNRDSFIWGAYTYLDHLAISHAERGSHDFTRDGFDFYADNRGRSNFQMEIPNGEKVIHDFLFVPNVSVPGAWSGQYYSRTASFVSPGTYFMYCTIFGIPCSPRNVTITSIDSS